MVYFVGAGPGAVDLITLRGKKILEEADVIIYAGSLVNPALLEYAQTGCEIYNSAAMTLEDVTKTIIDKSRVGKTVVRLHTGDPSIYGAVREQMDILRLAEVEFESVPGVSSFCAAAACLDAEYTLPSVSQTVIITRLEGRTPVPEKESLKSLAVHKASMAIFLSASSIDEVCELLIAGGYEPSTPAAIVYKASWPEEKKIVSDLENLPTKAKAENITRTALILVGGFLGDEYGRSKLYDPSFSHEFRKGTDK